MNNRFRVVFMGTPDFAVESLQALINEFDVVGVITAPDKPAGRGKKIQCSPVKAFSQQNHVKSILQPTNLKDKTFVSELQSLNADLFVVVAFRMLPEIIWSMPRLGTINLHASLLPQYRGAAPINWAIIHGEKKTGVTTFFIEKDIDTGKIIRQEEVIIEHTDTAGILHDKLMTAGAKILIETVRNIADGVYEATPQHKLELTSSLKQAPKIFKDDCRINWDLPAKKVYDFIRGLSPYPAAWTELISSDGRKINTKIFFAHINDLKSNASPGSIDYSEKGKLKVACADNYIEINELQIAGKKRMKTAEFLKGFHEMNSFNSFS